MGETRSGALAGLRVVEMGQLIAGPFCGQLLGDMGAEVLKIEPPGKGDPMRAWGRGDVPLWWEVIARNKKSVAIDLRKDAGRALVRRLLATADVLVENFRPGTLERWELSPDALRTANPRLIVARVSGYGQTGPYAERAGYGGIGEAMGGLRYVVGDPAHPPSRVGISIGDTLAATYACMGVLAALHHRDVSGQGQVVDASLFESVLQVMESLVPDYAVSGYVRERSGAILPGIAPSNVYACRDGSVLIGANQDTVFARLCQAMGQSELAADARFAGHLERGQHQVEIDALIEGWTRARTVGEVEATLLEHGVPAGRMFRAPEMLGDPHFAAREAIVELPHPRFGSVKMQNAFPRLSATPSSVRTPAPGKVGEHTEEVLGGVLGIGGAELAKLARDAVIQRA